MPIHGFGGVLYLSPGTGAAIRVAELLEYSIEHDADFQDITACEATWDTNVKGSNKWTASCRANFNEASKTLWSAAIAAVTQRFYLYHTVGSPTAYYYGMCWVKLGTALAGGARVKSTSGISITGDSTLSVNP